MTYALPVSISTRRMVKMPASIIDETMSRFLRELK